MADMSQYKETLKELAKLNSEEFINNSSMDHAAAMIEQLFLNAKGKMYILADHLKPQVYNRQEVKSAADNFLANDENEINIVVQLKQASESSLSANGFLTSLAKHKDKIHIFKATAGKLQGLENHFLIAKTNKDNYAMRYELNIRDHIATGCFNAGDNGKKLYDFISSMVSAKQNLQPIPITV